MGTQLVAAVGQQPGDSLWHGLMLTDPSGQASWVNCAADFAWAPDSQHVAMMPISPGTQSAPNEPFYSSLDFFPAASGFGPADTVHVQDLGITQPGLPVVAQWLGNDRVVVVLANVVLEENGYSRDPDLTDSVWLANTATGSPASNPVNNAGAEAAAVSPNGAQVAFVDGNSLTITPLDNSASCTITLTHDLSSGSDHPMPPRVAWSPDGSKVVVALNNAGAAGMWVATKDCLSSSLLTSGTYTFGATYIDDITGDGTPPLVTSSGEFVTGPLEWSSDGRWIYYLALSAAENSHPVADPDFGLRRISVNGGSSELLDEQVEWFDIRH